MTRLRKYVLLCLLLCLLLCCIPAFAQERSPSEKPVLRVLFIGNSYTFYNDLPGLFARLADAGHQKKIIFGMEAPAAVRLKDHWQRAQTRKALQDQKWDYVVLQDQSLLGTDYFYEGKPRIPSDELFHPYAVDFAKLIHDAGAIPVFYLTWARKNVPEDQAALTAAYMRAARQTKSIVAPVGLAWAEVEKAHPEIDLFRPDGSHPSPAGTYLTACVFYATIFGRSPEGLPAEVAGTSVNADNGTKSPVKIRLPKPEARDLQKAAWEASVDIRLHGANFSTEMPRAPALPPLAVGKKLDSEDLSGTWNGKLLFFPSGPAEMTLRLQPALLGWNAHLDLRFHTKGIADVYVELDDVHVGERELRFTVPQADGVDNMPIHFTGVLNDTGELIGNAEASEGEGEHAATTLGRWTLTKK